MGKNELAEVLEEQYVITHEAEEEYNDKFNEASNMAVEIMVISFKMRAATTKK